MLVRTIKGFDADADVVDRRVRYLAEPGLPSLTGVGMRAMRWHQLSIRIRCSHLQSVVSRMRLGKPANSSQRVKLKSWRRRAKL
jgi:hypothetical protein